jgi:uncharacterized membrane protein YraQ (UPF0718 family)
MYVLYLVTLLALLISAAADIKKTLKALKISLKKFLNIIPVFITMLILVSIILFLIPDQLISNYLGNNDRFSSVILASLMGSITLMPGFTAFPICGVLLNKGVSYMILSAFTTTLMMVGILTFPLEKKYFGARVTIIRNIISFIIALMVALSVGLFYGEIL